MVHRSLPRVVVATVVAGMAMVAGLEGQTNVWVHARTGCDANSGLTAGTPVQTLTRALAVAAGLTPPVTVRLAGALVPGTATRIPYDNLQNASQAVGGCSTPLGTQGVETFPLNMIGQVSLAWEAPTSDVYPPPISVAARPLIRFSVAYAATLLNFGPTYVGGPAKVNLTSLDLEYGQFGVRMDLGAAAGTVSPTLDDLRVVNCYRGVEGVAFGAGDTVTPTIRNSYFALLSAAPPPSIFGRHVMLLGYFAGASTGGTITGCTLRVEEPQVTEAGITVGAYFDSTGTVTIENSLIEGGTPNTPPTQGMGRGIELGAIPAGGSNAPGTLVSTVRGNTIQYCRRDALRLERAGAVNTSSNTPSLFTIASNRAIKNFRDATGTAPRGQIHLAVGSGRALRGSISSNTVSGSGLDAIVLGLTGYGVIGSAPGTLDFTIDANRIQECRDGIVLRPSSGLIFRGSVSRNSVLQPSRHGIWNYVFKDDALETRSDPDIVNNIVAQPGGDGIRNQINVVAAGPFSAVPRLSFNTVAFAPSITGTSAGLRNLSYGAGLPAFTVHNSIFRYAPYATGGGDIVNGPPGSPPGLFPLTVGWCNFSTPPPPPPTNNMDPPSFVNPGALDLHLAPTSLLIDSATETPIVRPPTDIDGDARIIDFPPPSASNRADRGADERRP